MRQRRRQTVRVLLGVLVAASLAMLVAAGLVVAPRSRPAGIRAQSSGSDGLLRGLAERLLGSSNPNTLLPSQFSPVQLLPGALPPDLPVTLPLPPESTLIGSAVRPAVRLPSPTPPSRLSTAPTASTTQAAGQHVDVVLDATGSVSDILGFYTDAMTALGWSALPAVGLGGPGFQPSMQPPSSETLCAPAGGPLLGVSASPQDDGSLDVRLNLETGSPASLCRFPFGGPVGAPAITPGVFSALPRLTAPAGLTVQNRGGQGGYGRATTEALATTDRSPAALESLYEQQLVAAGWTRLDGGDAEVLAWSTWTIPNQTDWRGFLYVREAPGEGQLLLHLEAASPNPGATTGVIPGIVSTPGPSGPAPFRPTAIPPTPRP